MFAYTACNDVVFNEHVDGTGYLSVDLGVDDDVATKAIVDPAEDMTFKIYIYKGTECVHQINDHRDVTQAAPVELTVGKYRVVAVHGSATAGFDSPYYMGETEVNIVADELRTADVTCSLANVMVTVDFEQSLRENFNSYSVYVEDGNGQGLTFNSSNLGSVGYIPATGSLKWTLTLVNSDGKSYTYSETYSEVNARQHYKLQFGLSEKIDNAGFAAIKLIVDDTLVEQKYDVELDFAESEMPSVSTNEGFDLTNEISVIVGDASKKELTFSAPEGITSFALSLGQSSRPYDLVEATQDDINTLAAMGIKTQSVPFGSTTVKVDITDYIKNLPTGTYNLSFRLYDAKGHVASAPLNISVISEVDAIIESVTPWAKFVIVKGKYFSAAAPDGLALMYKKSSSSNWATVTGSALQIDAATKTFTAEIGGLDAESVYEIKAVSAKDTDTEIRTFRTGKVQTLYNMNFDEWYSEGKVYYPYTNGANPTIWDCANTATASFGVVAASKSYTTPSDYAIKGKSALLESAYVVIKFAAGNLYTGKFLERVGTKGARLNWGVPFESRPVALKGYYDYTSGTIDRAQSPYSTGGQDRCSIQIILTDWDEPALIDTPENLFVDVSMNNKSIIAYGKIESDVTTNGYKEFTLPLEYRDLTRTPKYIVIACCSSYLGDYFTGSTSSKLYVDEFSFEYDVTKLTPEERALVNYK